MKNNNKLKLLIRQVKKSKVKKLLKLRAKMNKHKLLIQKNDFEIFMRLRIFFFGSIWKIILNF